MSIDFAKMNELETDRQIDRQITVVFFFLGGGGIFFFFQAGKKKKKTGRGEKTKN